MDAAQRQILAHDIITSTDPLVIAGQAATTAAMALPTTAAATTTAVLIPAATVTAAQATLAAAKVALAATAAVGTAVTADQVTEMAAVLVVGVATNHQTRC